MSTVHVNNPFDSAPQPVGQVVENNLDAQPAAGKEVDNEEPVQMPDKEVEEGRGQISDMSWPSRTTGWESQSGSGAALLVATTQQRQLKLCIWFLVENVFHSGLGARHILRRSKTRHLQIFPVSKKVSLERLGIFITVIRSLL